jgi:hypothetical protein
MVLVIRGKIGSITQTGAGLMIVVLLQVEPQLMQLQLQHFSELEMDFMDCALRLF